MASRTTAFGADHGSESRLLEAQARRVEIEEQLERLLASQLFKNSRHYPALLRYVVEQTIQGHGSQLKERSVGSAVLGRAPGYDTNLDPVVRTSACEVRKRIAQYYHEPGHEREVRIDLPSGSYVPEFHFPEPEAPPVLSVAAPVTIPRVSPITAALRAAAAHPVFAGIGLAALAIGVATASLHTPRSPLDQFWGPVWNASDTVVVCLGGRPGVEAAQSEIAGSPVSAESVPTALDVMRSDRIAFADAVTMGRLLSVIRARGKKYDVRRSASTTLTDLRKGPVILVGAFNNAWTLRLKNGLRYTFEREGDNPAAGVMRIRDRQHPADARWRIDDHIAYNKLVEDYAIVSRVVDPLTEKIVVTVAGMTKDGTLAAGEFVTEDRYLAALVSKAPAGWESRNVQVVLGTELVNGVSGPPRVLATHFW